MSSKEIQNLIGRWKEKRSFKALMDSDITLCDPDDLRKELMNMKPAQRDEAKQALQDVSNLLVERIQILKQKRENLGKQIERSKQTQKACLAYHKQDVLNPDYKEKKSEDRAYRLARIQEREERLLKDLIESKDS